MNKKGIFSELRRRVSDNNIRAPRDMDFYFDKNDSKLIVTLIEKGLIGNMQDNASAFESWILPLKHYLSDMINQVEIVVPDNIAKKLQTENNLHFNRFVYRLSRFLETYEWATTSWEMPLPPSEIICNVPTKENSSKDKHKNKKSEGWIECDFIDNKKDEFDIINHQLPVGLFIGNVDDKKRYTTGQKSALDIWAIKKDELSIFELKKEDNIMIGIISELFFYTNVIVDIINHKILYDETDKKTTDAINNNYRGFKDMHKFLLTSGKKRINAIMLANNIHPLITDDLLSTIGNSPRWRNNNVVFFKQKL